MDLNRIRQLAGMEMLVEAKTKEVNLAPIEKSGEYDSSEDFEAAYSNISMAAKHIVEVMKSPAFKDWMEQTADNFSKFDLAADYKKPLATAEELKQQLEQLYEALSTLD